MDEPNVSQDSTIGTTPAEVDSTVEQGETTQEVIPQTTEEQGQSEESFFDPKTVPEELLPAYKQMQAAFTKKTQEIANTRKEAEALKAKVDAFSKYEQYVPIVEEMLSQKGQQVNPELVSLEQELRQKGYSDEAIEMMKLGAQFTLNQFNQRREADKTQAAFDSGIEQADKLDARLNDQSLVYTLEDGTQSTFGEMVSDMVAAIPNWRKDPVTATKKAIAKIDALIGKAKTEGKEELSTLAKNKAAKFPSVNGSSQSAVNNQQPTTIREAAKLAAAEMGVKL